MYALPYAILKAGYHFIGYVHQHEEPYLGAEIDGTEGAAPPVNHVASSRFSTAEFVCDEDATFKGLSGDGSHVLAIGTVRALLSRVANLRAGLLGKRTGSTSLRRVIEHIGTGVGSTAPLELLSA